MPAPRRRTRLTVRRKLMAILMLTSGVALLLACVTFAAHSRLRFRAEAEGHVGTLARVTANQARIAFEQGDLLLAEQMLAGLSAEVHVLAAALYDPDGVRRATFLRESDMARLLPARSPLQATSRFQDGSIEVSQPVYSGADVIGSVVVVADERLIQDHFWSFSMSLPLVLVASAGVAFLLSRRLQMLISGPIHDLSQVARRVSRRHDYSLRVEPQGDSVETDALAHSFNEMLDTIQLHERELTASRDAAEQASQAKAEFLANVSHEIRTPMNGVIGLTDLLMRSPLSDDQREYTRIIQTSGQTLLHLINDVLDLSKVEAGKLELENIEFDVRETLENVLAMLAGTAFEKGLDLGLCIEHDVPRVLCGDPIRLQQVVSNLLSNAVKFTDRGEVLVQVRAASAAAGGDQKLLEVAVQDTGIGLADGVRERIFESFLQADGSTTRRFGGTGLGLALCKRLVEQMGGEITVDSRPGYGSTFRFTCELGSPGGGGVAGLSAEFTDLRGRVALLVSESVQERRILAHHLELVGVSCQELAPEEWGSLGEEARNGDLHDFALISERAYRNAELPEHPDDESPFPVIVIAPLGAPFPDCDVPGLEVRGHLTRPVFQRPLLQCLRKLPASRRGGTAPGAVVESLSPGPRDPSARRILVAEDHPVNQKVVGEMLKRLECPFDLVDTGTGVLAALASDTGYDLILMDCQMPEMDGYEAARRIRAGEEEGEHIPIVALTANATTADRDQALAAGMDDYLSKPVVLEHIRDTLGRWLEPAAQT